MSLEHAWKFMIDLFDFKELERTIKGEVPKGRLRYGVPNYMAGILLALFSMFMLTTLTLVYFGFLYDALSESYFVVTSKPELTYGFFISSAIYFGLIMFPYLLLGSFIYQGLTYWILKLLGGKGNFKKQYYITSYIALALGMGTLGFVISALLGFFLPCLNLFFLLVYLAASVYLVFYVQPKMLMEVHKCSALLAFGTILFVSIGAMLAFLVVNFAVEYFGLLPDFTATFTISGINENMLNISLPDTSIPTNVTANATNATNATS